MSLSTDELREQLKQRLMDKLQGQSQAPSMDMAQDNLNQARDYQARTQLADSLNKSSAMAGSIGGKTADVGATSEQFGNQAVQDAQQGIQLARARDEDAQKSVGTLGQLENQDYEAKANPLKLQAQQQEMDQAAKLAPLKEKAMQASVYGQNLNNSRTKLEVEKDTRTEKDMNDPNSDASRTYQAYAERLFPGKDFTKATGNNLASVLKIGPSVGAMDMKVGQTQDKQFQAFGKEMNPATASSRNGIGAANGQLRQIQGIKAMVAANPSLNFDPVSMRELATSIATVVGGGKGSSALGQVNELTPHSISGDAAKIKSWLTDNPTGTGQQAYVKNYIKILDKEEQAARDNLAESQYRTAQSYSNLADSDPQRFEDTLRMNGIEPKSFYDKRDQLRGGITAPKLTSDVVRDAQGKAKMAQGTPMPQSQDTKIGRDGLTYVKNPKTGLWDPQMAQPNDPTKNFAVEPRYMENY